MAERREDVEELLRLKTNPFPDGTLEAPEFPRRVYASNVVQPVNAQLVAQSNKGPKLLSVDDSGSLQVTIPSSGRPLKQVFYLQGGLWSDLPAHTSGSWTNQFAEGWIYRIISINLTGTKPNGATLGSVDFTIRPLGYQLPMVIVSWPYNVNPSIVASQPMGNGVIIYPGPEEAWLKALFNLRFDINIDWCWQVDNNTDATLSATGFSIDTIFYREQI